MKAGSYRFDAAASADWTNCSTNSKPTEVDKEKNFWQRPPKTCKKWPLCRMPFMPDGHGTIFVLQAKDGRRQGQTINHVMSSQTQGRCRPTEFQSTSIKEELKHDLFCWRVNKRRCPPAGSIAIFNRPSLLRGCASVVQLHDLHLRWPDGLPRRAGTGQRTSFAPARYRQIRHYEQYLLRENQLPRGEDFSCMCPKRARENALEPHPTAPAKNLEVLRQRPWPSGPIFDDYQACTKQVIDATAVKECPCGTPCLQSDNTAYELEPGGRLDKLMS